MVDAILMGDKNFDIGKAFSLHFWRKTIDYLVYIYLAIVIAVWVAQDIPDLRFKAYTYTLTSDFGVVRDYCSTVPLLNLTASTVATIYANASIGSLTDKTKQLQALMLHAADLPIIFPSPFFSIPGRSYCLGAAHYAVAHDIPEPPDIEILNDLWTVVRQQRAVLYGALNTQPHTGRIIFIFTLALWIYLLCRIGHEIYMIVLYYKYETDWADTKIQPMFYPALWSSFIPVLLNTAVAIMIVMKISGTCLTADSAAYWILGVHLIATFLQYLPLLLLRISSLNVLNSTPTGGVNAEVKFTTRFGGATTTVNANFVPPPATSHIMTVYYYIVVAVMVQIASLYVSGELSEMHYAVYNTNCDAGTIQGCIDEVGGSRSSGNAHYILAFAAPVLLRLVWAIGYFTYFCTQVDASGGVTKTDQGSSTDTIAVELQANVAAITEWRVRRLVSKDTNNIKEQRGMRLSYGTLLPKTDSMTKMRLILVGRFLIPMVTVFIAFLFGILKLSEYIVWHGFPWWGIGVMIVSAILVSLTIELVPVVIKRMNAHAPPKKSVTAQ